MGRFYKTTKANYVNDFLFEPPWEMAQAVLAKKEEKIQNNINTLEIFRDIPVDYWNHDKERAIKEKELYNSEVEKITQEMQKDILNPENRNKINALKRQFQKSYTTGNISKLRESALNHRKHLKELEALPNPSDREYYKRKVQDYIDEDVDGTGAYSKIFNPSGEMFNHRNFIEEYAGSEMFKGLTADQIDSTVDSLKGLYKMTETDRKIFLSENKIVRNLSSFIKGENIELYAKDAQNYKGEKWYEKDGSLALGPGSMFYGILTGAKSLAYSQKSNGNTINANQVALQLQRQNYERDRIIEERAFNSLFINQGNPDIFSDASEIRGQSIKIRETEEFLKQEVIAKFGFSPNTSFEEVKKSIFAACEEDAKNSEDPEKQEYAESVIAPFIELEKLKAANLTASYNALTDMGVSVKDNEKYRKLIRKAMNNGLFNTQTVIFADTGGANVLDNIRAGEDPLKKPFVGGKVENLVGKKYNGKTVASIKKMSNEPLLVNITGSFDDLLLKIPALITYNDGTTKTVNTYTKAPSLTEDSYTMGEEVFESFEDFGDLEMGTSGNRLD